MQNFLIILFVGLTVALLAYLMSLTRALREQRGRLKNIAARKDFSARLLVQGPAPAQRLARRINEMLEEAQAHVANYSQQHSQLEELLSSMTEGVIAVDLDEHVIRLNQAAATLLDVDVRQSMGRSIQEVVRNTKLLELVAQTLRSSTPVSTDVVFNVIEDDASDQDGERYLQAQGTTLRDRGGNPAGALIVMHDVTRLRRLEVVRRDFVANVSHELKTPITAIRGFVETLLDTRPEEVEDRRRFLNIMLHQSDRLQAIVEDLLSLARIEREYEQRHVELEITNIRHVLEAAVEGCRPQADAKQVKLELTCPEELKQAINSPMLEQAVVNLLDNAIKYSPAQSLVSVKAETGDQTLVVSVSDQGRGIERQHLPRIFERFYRVDRARSRSMGGTGLGLSIVKHVAQAHGGTVSVDSTVGRGSTFRILLPRVAPPQATS